MFCPKLSAYENAGTIWTLNEYNKHRTLLFSIYIYHFAVYLCRKIDVKLVLQTLTPADFNYQHCTKLHNILL